MREFVAYIYFSLCLLCGITAIYNIARSTPVFFSVNNSVYENTKAFTDGIESDTCQKFNGHMFNFRIGLGEKYNIKSLRIIFKGKISTDKASIEYFDPLNNWPFEILRTYSKELPHLVEFDVQRIGSKISFDIEVDWNSSLVFELCEIEVHGCETDHFGSSCQPCIKNDNCEVCDVNDGTCYICKETFTGPTCSRRTENVALQKEAILRWNFEGFDAYLPSYLLVDGYTKRPSCIAFNVLSAGEIYKLRVNLLRIYNIKGVQFHFIKDDPETIWFKYTVYPYWSYLPSVYWYSGMEELSAVSTEVIIPYPKQLGYIDMEFTLSPYNGTEALNTSIFLCEVEVNGCLRNHYGNPCRPCSKKCDQCNAVDGSCICRSGYTGESCTEECKKKTFGPNCVYNCGHCLKDTCHQVTGNCLFGCQSGWTTSHCNQACNTGWYGENCTLKCSSHCITPYLCDRFNGSCTGGCALGWKNDTCDVVVDDSCVDWMPSDVSVSYQTMTWRKREINHVTRYDPAVTLSCIFSLKSEEFLFYHVTWFIDKQEVFNQVVDVSSNYSAELTAYDILNVHKKMGCDINCKVGAMRMKNNTPCLFKEGRPFFAGIRTRNPNIELERKGSKNVELEMTIPYASESIVINGVPEPVSDLDIHLFFKSNHTSHCSGSMTTSNCNIKLRSFSYNERHKYENGEWKKSITFQVFNQDTDNYVINSQWTLQTRTGITKGIGSKIFEDVSLPDISLRSLETNEEWKGKFCSVRADPHMYTFDGKSYECHLPGDFNNYRNDPYLQWIQSRHHLCFPSNNFPMCVCAVAARAGRDVFVIDFCGANGAIKFELCDDNVLVVIKVNDKHYKIYFPTGTTLSVYITDWNGYYNIDLEINPSSLDFGNSYGLCGFFDGVIDNDVTRRDKTTTDSIELTYPNTFSNSWKVQASENLFSDSLIYLGLKSISNVLGSNCKCTDSGQTECSYRTFTPCNFDQGKRYECDKNQVQNRQDLDISRKPEKPDVEDQRVQDRQQEGLVTKKTEEQDVHKDQVQNQGQEGDLSSEPGEPDVDNPKERDVLINTLMTFVQTKEYATIVCLKAFQDSPEYNTCQKHVPDVVNITIANCIEDVKMTGDESLIQMHVEAALQQCSMFVFLNETFQESEPDITYSIQNLCPSNCSSHGTCEGGNCTCDAGFGGSDCSFDFLGPPTITSVPSAGLCDLSTTTCKEATILGKYFFENMDSICYINVHQVDVNQSTLRRESTKNTLKERTLFEGYCPIPFNTTGIWTTEINFKISNDKLRFTDTYQIFIYQSTCQEYHNDSGNVFFTLKSAFCYIDGTCVNPMEKSMMNKCLYCNALNDKFNWTENEYCSHTTHSAIDDGTPSSTTYVELESTILMEELTKRYPQYHRSIIGTPGKSGDDEEESEAPELDTDFFFLFFLFVSNFLPFILLIIFICLFKHRKRPPQRPQ